MNQENTIDIIEETSGIDSYEAPEVIDLGDATVLILGPSGKCCDNTTDSSEC